MNGQNVLGMTEPNIQKLLKANQSSVRLVVLRPYQPTTSHVTVEELDSVKEDLSLAMLELESAQQENQDLTDKMDE